MTQFYKITFADGTVGYYAEFKYLLDVVHENILELVQTEKIIIEVCIFNDS